MTESSAVSDESAPLSHTRLTLTVKHALDVLWAFSLDAPSWGVNELSRHLGLHKSMVSRLLATLEERRLVQRDPLTDKFRLGIGVVELAGVVLSQMDLRQAAAGPMRRLAEVTRETVNVAILDRGQVVVIDQVPSPEPVKYIGWIGDREPAYCASPGKAMLAYSDPAVVQAVIDAGLTAYTPQTIVDPGELIRELETTRRRGFATNLGEFAESAHGVAAPIWKYPRTLAGAVAIAAPAYRLSPERLEELGQMVKATAADISDALGALPSFLDSDERTATTAPDVPQRA